MHLNRGTRKLWAEKIFELTNIGTGALLFGQFLSEGSFSFVLMIFGLILFFVGLFASWYLLKD